MKNLISQNLYNLEKEEWKIREIQTNLLFDFEDMNIIPSGFRWNASELLLFANSVLVIINEYFKKYAR
jgi:hypothetical protein